MSVMVNFNNDGGNTGVTASTTTQFVGAEGLATNSGNAINSGADANSTTSFVFNPEAGGGQYNEVSDRGPASTMSIPEAGGISSPSAPGMRTAT